MLLVVCNIPQYPHGNKTSSILFPTETKRKHIRDEHVICNIMIVQIQLIKSGLSAYQMLL